MSFQPDYPHRVVRELALYDRLQHLWALQRILRKTETLHGHLGDCNGKRVLIVRPRGVVRPWTNIGIRPDGDELAYTWEPGGTLANVPADGSVIGPVSDVGGVYEVIDRVFRERQK
ncbi:hypothetical protein [Spirillospora sp. CA-294931]|uniref:hypothetical protein n=1 Tax=Spirillospora sp. CA-294931 TaxID=3240042 RepID=UPI003D8C1C01